MKLKLFIATLAIFSLNAISYAAPGTPLTKEERFDSEVLGWLIVLDNNEIAAGKETLSKKVQPMTKDYANTMIKSHTENLTQTKTLSKKLDLKPVENEMAINLKKEGKEELATLKATDNKQYDKTYIDAMVKGHTNALETLNTDIGSVQNPNLKQHLEATAEHVKMHLEKAKAIQNTLSEQG